MRAQRQKKLIIAGSAIVLAIIAAIAAILLFNINSYKSNIEAAASEATGLDIKIRGRMGLSFFPFGVSARDIHVTVRGDECLSLERFKLRVELMSLITKKLKATGCEVTKPAVLIVKDVHGKYNFEIDKPESMKGRRRPAFSFDELRLSNGTLVHLDKKTGEKTELKEINLALKDVTVVAGAPEDIIKNISFTGTMECKELRRKDLKADRIKGPVKAEKGVFSAKPLTMDIFGAQGEGDVAADVSEAEWEHKINLSVSKLDFEKVQESFGIKRLIGGKGDLAASLTVKGKVDRPLLERMDGTVSLRGNNLITYTMDLDKALSSYETSQEFNLVDVGAFFIAGPLGSAALKGYRYGDVYYQTRGGRGAITQFVSHWRIKEGVADATDCALATRHNRVALKGRLNLISERYDNVVVAILDDKGCIKFKQSISGPFGAPSVGVVSTVEGTLTGPIMNLFRQGKRLVHVGRCEVFYTGAVQQPR